MKKSGRVPLSVWTLLVASGAVACIAEPDSGKSQQGDGQTLEETLPVGHPTLSDADREAPLEERRLQVNCGSCHQGT